MVATRRDGAAALSWEPPARTGGATILLYQVAMQGSDAWTPVDGTRTVMRGLANGTAYTFLVRAINIAGTSPSARSNAVTPAGVPSRVARPTARVTGKKVRLRWEAAEPNGARITAYRITNGKRFSKVVPGKRHRAVLKQLRPGKHRLRIAARNAAGWSTPSTPVVVRVRRR